MTQAEKSVGGDTNAVAKQFKLIGKEELKHLFGFIFKSLIYTLLNRSVFYYLLVVIYFLTSFIPTFSQTSVRPETTILTIDSGFVEIKIINSNPKETFVNTSFFDLKGDRIKNNNFKLSKSELFGQAENGKEVSLFFYDDLKKNFLAIKIDIKEGTVQQVSKPLKKRIARPKVISFNQNAIYCSTKQSSGFTITKLDYSLDTLWTKIILDDGIPLFINNTFTSNNFLFLNFNSVRQSSRIICLNDSTGDIVYDRMIQEFKSSRVAHNIHFDETKNILFVAGEQYKKREPNGVNTGYFILQFNSTGQAIFNKYYDKTGIKEEDVQGNVVHSLSTIPVFQKDFFYFNHNFYFLTEHLERTDFKGEGIAVGFITGLTLGVSILTEKTKFTSFDLYLLKASEITDSISSTRIKKQPISKAYFGYLVETPAFYHALNPLKPFDYKLTIDGSDGEKGIIYYDSIGKNEFTIKNLIISPNKPLEIKSLLIPNNDLKKSVCTIHQINREKLLLEFSNKENTIRGFKVVNLTDFK
ncbi:MAG TPA: hypothetical protein VD908_08060 [Cytophagales bacterium]|nr:hypothetical protein [Cytophagales bacterium]